MSEAPRPELSVGSPPGKLAAKLGGVPRAWFWLLVVLQAGTLTCLVVLAFRPGAFGRSPANTPEKADPGRLKSVAVALEERGLSAEAADAWQAYLGATPAADDRPQVLYRVGRLRADAGQLAEAAAALVEAEQATPEDDEELRRKVGRLLVDCLESQGLYGEAGRERSRLVETGTKEPGKAHVLATVGGEPITEADADRMIRRRVDQQLALAGVPDDDAKRKQMLEQLADPRLRRQVLDDMLLEELMVRRARELKLDQSESFAVARRAAVDQLLAGRLTDRELGDVEPTDLEFGAYYKTVQERFKQPESLEVVLLPVDKDGDAAALLAKIHSAEDFRKLALEATPENGAGKQPTEPPTRTVRHGEDPLLGTTDPLFELAEGKWTAKPVGEGASKYLVLVEKKNPERTPPLEEVRPQVRSEYMMQKQQELLAKLRQSIFQRYEVRFSPVPAASQPSPSPEESAP